jgi:acetyl esterase/lipase
MAIFDPTKIRRPEVAKLLHWLQELRSEVSADFFARPENQTLDFKALVARVVELNARVFAGEDVSGTLTLEERIFFARFLRFSAERRGEHLRRQSPVDDTRCEPVELGGVPVERQTPPEAGGGRTLLYIHGGGFVLGSAAAVRHCSVSAGRALGAEVWSVDYRLAPEHPHPAAVEDCFAVYRELLDAGTDPGKLLLGGESAGACLALLAMLRARDEGLPLPAGAFCIGPVTDLAGTGESLRTNAPTDPILADIGTFWWIESYFGDTDPRDPGVSPLYADPAGLPPLLFQVSRSEMLYDDTRRFAAKATDAGVAVTLQEWDETLHAFHYFPSLPEAGEAIENIGAWGRPLIGG